MSRAPNPKPSATGLSRRSSELDARPLALGKIAPDSNAISASLGPRFVARKRPDQEIKLTSKNGSLFAALRRLVEESCLQATLPVLTSGPGGS